MHLRRMLRLVCLSSVPVTKRRVLIRAGGIGWARKTQVPKYMWQEKAPTKPVEPKESPMCVASVAELFLPDDLKLNSPKKEDREPPKANVRNLASPTDSEDVDNCSDQFSGLFKLEGIALVPQPDPSTPTLFDLFSRTACARC